MRMGAWGIGNIGMGSVTLNLVVIRSRDIDRLAAFYSAIGLNLVKHKHGSGQEHFSHENGPVVFEIYPQQGDENSTTGVRIGFQVQTVIATVEEAVRAGAQVVYSPKISALGLRAIIDDPDGHRAELIEPIFVVE